MLKKIFALTTVFIFMASFASMSASVFYISDCNIEILSGSALISGIVYNKSHELTAGEVITVRIDNPDFAGEIGASSEVSEIASGADGSFSYRYLLGNGAKSGRYTVYTGGRNIEKRLENVFYYINPTDKSALAPLSGIELMTAENLEKLGIFGSLVSGSENEIADMIPKNGSIEEKRDAILFGGIIKLLNTSADFSNDFNLYYNMLPIYAPLDVSADFQAKLSAMRPFSGQQDFFAKINEAILQSYNISKPVNQNLSAKPGQTVSLCAEFESTVQLNGIEAEFRVLSGGNAGLTANDITKSILNHKIPFSDTLLSVKKICDLYVRLSDNAAGAVEIPYDITVYKNNYPVKLSGIYTIIVTSANQNSPGGSVNTGGGSGGGGVIQNILPLESVNTSIIPNASENNSFFDLEGFEWADESIQTLLSRGIIDGFPDGSFKPGEKVTRAQFAKLLVTAFNIPKKDNAVSFSDVSADDWFYEYVDIASANGIVNGNDEGRFLPSSEITRQDMAVMLFRAANAVGIILERYTMPSDFSDMEFVSEYARESVTRIKQAGIMNGMDNNNFLPAEFANRAQAAKVIFEMMRF